MFKTSWKTSSTGIISLVVAALTMVIQPMIDTDPATVPQWGAFFTVLTTSLGLLAARDHDVSSEKAGVNGPVK